MAHSLSVPSPLLKSEEVASIASSATTEQKIWPSPHVDNNSLKNLVIKLFMVDLSPLASRKDA
jgi:hypothetical protein